MLNGEKVSVEGINTKQVKRDEKRLKEQNRLKQIRITSEPVRGSVTVETTHAENESDSSDIDFDEAQEPDNKKRKLFRRGVDYKPVLLQAVRYGSSDQCVQDLTRTFCRVHDLDDTYWITKSTINRHQIKLRDEVLKQHHDEIQ